MRGRNRNLDAALNRLVTAAEQKSAVTSGVADAARTFLRPLGSFGLALAELATGRPIKAASDVLVDTISQAARLLDQLAPQLFGRDRPTDPEQAGGRRTPVPERRNPEEDVRQSGPESGIRLVGGNRVQIVRPGYRATFRTDDPIVTGVMIPVRSSNVHSIGFRMDYNNPATRSELIVRYLQSDKTGRSRAKVPGPTYAYRGVHPDLFQSFRIANSKGRFVWDELRIRGTVVGHQYAYTLERMAQGYVPRRAALVNGQQWLLQRTKTAHYADGRSEQVRSIHPNQRIGSYRPSSNRPNRGNPDRGRPNRGR
jgi:hypothetical protein